MAKFTHILLFVYITLILSSFVLAQPPKGKKKPEVIKNLSKFGKVFHHAKDSICVSYKSVIRSKHPTTAELFHAKKPAGKGLGKLLFPNDGKIHKKPFPKVPPGNYKIKYTFDAILATVVVRDRP